jgi:hypothetical protein
VLGRKEEADKLYPGVVAALRTGTLITFHCRRLLATTAGIAEAAGAIQAYLAIRMPRHVDGEGATREALDLEWPAGEPLAGDKRFGARRASAHPR